MAEQESQTPETEVKTFTQEDIDKLTADLSAKHQDDMDKLASKLRAEFKEKEAKAKADAEKQARQANMSELEKANEQIKELESKYQEQVNVNEITAQKEETRKLMTEMGVDLNCLDFVFIPKDADGTKARIQAFKEYTDTVKKNTFENGVKSTVPNAGKPPESDPFLDGFDNGLHAK